MADSEILITSLGFAPNVGGLETHLSDLVSALVSRGIKTHVLTYQPLTQPITVPIYQQHLGYDIYRLPILRGWFYKLVHQPLLEFLYLLPGFFIFLPVILILYPHISTIHSHGLVVAAPSLFWGKIFGKKVIATTHSVYEFPKTGIYHWFSAFIFSHSDHILCLSRQSANEIVSLGVPSKKVSVFTYWIDLDRFQSIPQAREKLSWLNDFTVLFVGRLVSEKGIAELLASLSKWPRKSKLVIAGTGPLAGLINKKHDSRIVFVGSLNQSDLPLYYSAADLLIVPSVHEEGFGRVILESLACGTPVLGSRRGAIPEAMDNTVGKLIDISPENIASEITYYSSHLKNLKALSKNCRKYAISHYSQKNVESIISYYD